MRHSSDPIWKYAIFWMRDNIEKKSFAGMETIPRAQSDTGALLETLLGTGHVKQKSTNGSCFEWVVNGQKDYV